MAQVELRTGRLRLVPLSDEHLEAEVLLDADPQTMRFLSGRPRTRAEVEQIHAKRLARGRVVDGLGMWAGFLGDSEEFIGLFMLTPPKRASHEGEFEAELGYRLRPEHLRHGYASEGARELLRHGFQDIKVERIFAQALAVNIASRATMMSVGLRYERTFHDTVDKSVPGSDEGEVEYSITRERWLSENPTED